MICNNGPVEWSLSSAIGDRLRELRVDAELSQDDVAAAMRFLGVSWQRSTVATVEAGERSLSLEEVLVLALALSRLTHRDLRLSDLLPQWTGKEADEFRILVGELEVEASDLVAVLGGRKVVASEAFTRPGVKLADLEDAEVYRWRSREPGATVARGREAEQRAARKLGVEVDLVVAAAERTWGRGLTEERDRRLRDRLPKGTEPARARAISGHVTRELLEELAPSVKELAR